MNVTPLSRRRGAGGEVNVCLMNPTEKSLLLASWRILVINPQDYNPKFMRKNKNISLIDKKTGGVKRKNTIYF
jgi:hypothetical protein